jgi:serine phosphatase RsbU (regulator of sigma subunit)
MVSPLGIISTLSSVGIFAGLPDDALAEIASLLVEQTLAAGQPVFEKGEMGTCMYIIASGRVRVLDGPRIVDDLGPGEVFGEMAVLDSAPRSASVAALEDTSLFGLEQEALYSLLATRPEVAKGIIAVLTERLRARVKDMTSLHVRKEEVEHELQIGRQIQQGFLPEALPQPPGWEIAGRFRPAREVSGDFYDAFPLSGGALAGIVVADVCGKGVGAALFMALFRTLIRAYSAQNFVAGQSPGEVAEAAVRTVAGTSDYVARVHGKMNMFATMFVGMLDISTGTLAYVNAGHEPPILLRDGAAGPQLAPTGPAAGLFAGMPFRSGQLALGPGDTLLMYTDGVTDAHDPAGELFGDERLLSLVSGAAQEPAAHLLERIEARLVEHIAGAPQFDDITLMSLRRLPVP